jgi:hypothetical protein
MLGTTLERLQKGHAQQVKEVEAAAERAAVQSAAIIEEAMAQAEETRRRAAQESQSQVSQHSPSHRHCHDGSLAITGRSVCMQS